METLNNPKLIEEITDLLPNIKDRIEKSINEFNNYKEYLKEEKYEEIQNEKEEVAIKRAESIFDRLDEIVRRRKLVLINGKETIELIENVKMKIENIVKSCENDEYHLAKANDELIDKIIHLEERKMNKEIEPLQQQIDKIKQQFNIKKMDLDNQKLNFEEMKRNKEKEQWEHQTMNQIINFEEMKQIEEWTGMKIGNIIFDSNVDNWNQNTSVFDQKIINKSNLIFIIENEDGNLFGSYVDSKIKIVNNYADDPKSFSFSLKSNGRLSGMMKFDVKYPHYAFYVYNQSSEWLFGIGNGLWIRKQNSKNQSYSDTREAFNFNGIQNALCGKSSPDRFTPKRITVTQLI